MTEAKIKQYKFKDIPALAEDLGKAQDARGGDQSTWDRSSIVADMLTIGGYAPTEGPLVAFQDELDGTIPDAARTFADGNLRALAICDILKLVKEGSAPKDAVNWEVPVLIYPAGMNQEERERIRNRARDTTQTKTQHDYYSWALKLAIKNPTLGDTDLCRLIGPRRIRSQWANAVREDSTYMDEKGVERFKDGLPLDGKDIPAMLVNKQGPIQEVTRVRALPAFARAFFLLHPSDRFHKSFASSRDWKQAWDQDLRSPFGPAVAKAQTLKELLTTYPDSKLGAKVAFHAAQGKPERKTGRGEGKGAMTAAEREREVNTLSQAGTDISSVLAHFVRFIGGEVGYQSVEAQEFFDQVVLASCSKLTQEGKTLLESFEASVTKIRGDVMAKATSEEQAAAQAKIKAEQAAIKKARKGP